MNLNRVSNPAIAVEQISLTSQGLKSPQEDGQAIKQVPTTPHDFRNTTPDHVASQSDLEIKRHEFVQSDAFKEGLGATLQNLGCFWNNPAIDAQKDPSKIIIFNKEKTGLETHDGSNVENLPLDIEASHEGVKNFFTEELTHFYGKETTDFFYPEKDRNEPLTTGKIKDLQARINEFQDAAITSCHGDLKQYDGALHSNLEILKKTQEAVVSLKANAPVKSQVEALTQSVESQLGVSSDMALLMLGSGVALGAALTASSGGTLAMPLTALLHSCGALGMLTSHGSSLGTFIAGATAAKATAAGGTVSHIATTTSMPADAVGTLIGMATGGVIGLGVGIHDVSQSEYANNFQAYAFVGTIGIVLGASVGLGVGDTLGAIVLAASTPLPASSALSSYAHAAAFAAASL